MPAVFQVGDGSPHRQKEGILGCTSSNGFSGNNLSTGCTLCNCVATVQVLHVISAVCTNWDSSVQYPGDGDSEALAGWYDG
jgi:hypothetical protein